MLDILIAVVPVLILLLVSERLWHNKIIAGEYGRKFLHIVVGTYVAFWSYMISPSTIQVLSIAATIAIIIARRQQIFKAIHDVDRRTFGDVLYPLAVLIIATIATEPWIFTVAILFVALADGFAAVTGIRWGGTNTYMALGQKKSIVGTVTHFITAIIIMIFGYWLADGALTGVSMWIGLVWLPFATSVLENISPWGLDNIVSPVFVAFVLNSMTIVAIALK